MKCSGKKADALPLAEEVVRHKPLVAVIVAEELGASHVEEPPVHHPFQRIFLAVHFLSTAPNPPPLSVGTGRHFPY